MKPPYLDVINWAAVIGLLKGFLPAAFGAAVSATMEKSATFGQKLIQFAAGIIVSYYVSAAIHEMTSFGPMVQQSISFTLGMIGYESAKSFTKGASTTAGSIPSDVWAWIRAKFGMGGDAGK